MLEGSEWGRAYLASTDHMLRPGMTRLETADWALETHWSRVQEAARKYPAPGAVRSPSDALALFLPRDEVAASCDAFPDGTGLIVISDALNSLVMRLGAFNSLWRGGNSVMGRVGRRRVVGAAMRHPEKVIENATVQAAVAALRYQTQHIRVWGTSAAVGLRKDRPGLRDGAFAAAFIQAHELGHFVLGHVGGTPTLTAREAEFAADKYALHVLLHAFGAFDRVAVATAALIALCALQIWESSALIRDVRVHPPLLERWAALAEELGDAAAQAEATTHGARTMTGVAAADGALPEEFWETLASHDQFEKVHAPEYFRLIRGFDLTASMTDARRDELIATLAADAPDFRRGWQLLLDRGWAAALHAWGIDGTSILDSREPLGYLYTVNAIAAADVWGPTRALHRQTCALLVIHARSASLRTGSLAL